MRARRYFWWLGMAAGLAAQPPAAPTPASVGPVRGENTAGYNIVNSFETGYRFRSVGGDYGRYRSDVNYGNGLRLLAGQLSVHSREGRGWLFDEIVLSTQGLGNDPYQYSNLRVQKNRLYRYDFLWRLDEYYNPALPVAFGQHLMDTRRRLQDHDFVFLPQSKTRFFLGYTRNSQDGPALATVQEFGPRNDEFALFAGVRRLRREYRVGGEIQRAGVRFNWLRGWDDYKEDTPYSLRAPSQGNNPDDLTTLAALRRSEPYHGVSPYWRLGLAGEHPLVAVNGRFTYTAGRRSFLFDELASGTDRFGAARNRQILAAGSGRRPVASADLTLSFFPVARLTLTNHTAFHHTRTEGDSVYREVENATALDNLVYFRFLGIRAISNLTDASLRVTRWLGLYGGYHFSARRIRSIERLEIDGAPELTPAEQTNRQHSGLTGVRLQPVKPLRINLDAELSRADRPFFPSSERNYHALGARLDYRVKKFQFSAASRANINTNSVALGSYSARARNDSAAASWTPSAWLALEAGYSRLHLETLSGIAYFLAGRLRDQDRLAYLSNIHAAHLGLRAVLGRRAELYAGYSRVQDTADSPGRGSAIDALNAARAFPLTFQAPSARLSLRLHEKIRWNAGYQYYGYGERFYDRQNYRAHTGYTSVLWSF